MEEILNPGHKVFLGGTCNKSTWRNRIIKLLEIDYFNPVVEDWTPECQQEERRQKDICDIHLYTITPKMTGVFSICEVTDDSNKIPSGTVLCILKEDEGLSFPEFQQKSLEQVAKVIESNGGKVLYSLEDTANYLNLPK